MCSIIDKFVENWSYDVAEILLKLALNTNQAINHSMLRITDANVNDCNQSVK
jgi:hypothetical protein